MTTQRTRRSPGSKTRATSTTPIADTESTAQMQPVGVAPGVEELLVGALMYSDPAAARDVLRFVDDDDLDEPGRSVLASVRALAGRGVPPSPQLIADDLKRRGKLIRERGVWLAAATTSGACAQAAREYAAPVIAKSLRRQTESFGAALSVAAAGASEADLAAIAERASARVRYIAGRLAELRGEL
jgi:replicative DNA helicase